MPTVIHQRVAACARGEDPTLIARMASGWAVLGDPQVLRGYCLLLPDPVPAHLNVLPLPQRTQFLADMAALGDAVLAVTGALRINYALYGNLAPALHAHVFPRHADEPDFAQTGHPWVYDWSKARSFDPQIDAAMQHAICSRLQQAGVAN
ncbi:MAG: HIT family protein [Gammaproteobacteria bacterium]